MTRCRSNGISGEKVRLYAFFYKFGELAEPSSIGGIKIYDYMNNIIDSIVASDISSIDTGIKRIDFLIPDNSPKGEYKDVWESVIYDSGDDPIDEYFNFFVRDAVWDASDKFYFRDYDLKVELTQEVKLYEKKWLKFAIKDANNLLMNTDTIDLLFKDYGGSNLVYISTITINDGLNAYYYFNSSKLKADYPSYIDRENNYEWILKINYKDQTYQPDPIQFNFSFT